MNQRKFYLKWQFWVRVFLSMLIAVIFGLWIQTRGVQLIPPSEDMVVIKKNWWGIFSFFFILCAVHFFRAYRWVYLLRPLADNEAIKTATLLSVAFVGFFAIMVFPLRMGEFVRPYLISKRTKISMSSAFGTIAIERVVDGLLLSGILTFCLFFLPFSDENYSWVRSTGFLTLVVFVVAMLVLIITIYKGNTAVDFFSKIGSRVWKKGSEKVANVLREFLRGLSVFPNLRYLIPFLIISLLYWGINGFGMWLFAQSCGLPISVIGGFTIMTMLGVGILFPTGPGHFGNFQVAVWLALTLQGLSTEQMEHLGSVYIFMMYVFILGITVLAGAGALMTRHVSIRKALLPAEE